MQRDEWDSTYRIRKNIMHRCYVNRKGNFEFDKDSRFLPHSNVNDVLMLMMLVRSSVPLKFPLSVVSSL